MQFEYLIKKTKQWGKTQVHENPGNPRETEHGNSNQRSTKTTETHGLLQTDFCYVKLCCHGNWLNFSVIVRCISIKFRHFPFLKWHRIDKHGKKFGVYVVLTKPNNRKLGGFFLTIACLLTFNYSSLGVYSI